MGLKHGVFLGIDGARLFHEPYEEAQQVELHARALKDDNFLATLTVPSFEDGLDHIENSVLAPLIDGKAVLLGYQLAILVESPVQVVRFFEDGNISINHI